MTQEIESLASLVRSTFREQSGEFRPCAFFDEPLDCIRVVTRDCSATETRVSDLMTVLEDSYYDPASSGKKFVGFTIKGATHFCNERGFRLTAPIQLTEILDAILASSPNPLVRMAVDAIARPLVQETMIKPVILDVRETTPATA